MNDDSKVALVTGANRGIGLGIAKQLANLGNNVVLGSRDVVAGEKAARSIGSAKKVSAIQLDVTKQEIVERASRKIRKDFGRLDILVNNAGILLDETDRPSQTDLAVVKSTLDTNLIGSWRVSQSFLLLMRENNYGRIVNVSSGAGSLESIAVVYTLLRIVYPRQP